MIISKKGKVRKLLSSASRNGEKVCRQKITGSSWGEENAVVVYGRETQKGIYIPKLFALNHSLNV